MKIMTAVNRVNDHSVFVYELIGTVFIIMLGSVLHFTFEWSGDNSAVGAFSAVNESVWEHLKFVFWPALLFVLVEYVPSIDLACAIEGQADWT